MSRTGDTKKRILEMIEERNVTLTDISNKLGLAPSTVNQHLQELMDSGSIRLVEDRPRKWKYYEMNKTQPVRGYEYYQKGFDMKKVIVPLAIIVVALVAAAAFFGLRNNIGAASTPNAQQVYLAPNSTVPSGSTVFTVSDSPQLYNISALFVTIDNASIHSESNGKWYSIPLQANTFDLVKLDNISSILSGVKLSSGVYDDLVFYISNVTAVLNGTTENVFLPSGRLLVVGNLNISNNTTNWINLDFDLEHSIHITQNGSLIMLPVIRISSSNDTNLQVNESSIVFAGAPVKSRGIFELGMDENGIMVRNYSTPQNWSISRVGGRLEVNGNGFVPILVRTRHGLIIGDDEGGFFNASVSNSIFVLGTNESSNEQAMIANVYRRCIGLGQGSSGQSGTYTQSGNVPSLSDLAIILRGCCFGLPEPLVSGNYVVNGNITIGNFSLVANSINNIGTSGCCYPTLVKSANGTIISISRCMQMPAPIGFNSISNSLSWNKWNVTQLNISVVNNDNGNFNAGCEFQNGALSCSSNQPIRPQDIVRGVRQSIDSNGVLGLGWGNR